MNGHDSAVVLTVHRLAKAFGGVEAVRDVSFAVSAGEIVAMIGPNGAGKTTCFNLVNGQLAPDAGSVMLLGKRIDGLPPRTIARAGVGRTFQIAATFASMTVRENVQMALIAHAGRQRGIGSRATDLYVDEADMLLGRVGILTSDTLKEKRRYFIVVAFIIAAVLTPPDVISQASLAIPLLVLYEGAIFAVRIVEKQATTAQAAGAPSAANPAE